jgi:SGNH domain (fused to AT3 domains)
LVERPVTVLRVSPRRLLPAAAASVLAAAVLVSCGGSPTRQATDPMADGAPPSRSVGSQLAGAAATSQPATSKLATTPRAPSAVTERRAGQPLTVDVFGDSIGWTLVHYLPATPGFRFADRTVLGCGIVRGGPYRYFGHVSDQHSRCEDWPRSWAAQLAADRPDVALLVVGRWETMDRKHDGEWLHVGQPAFDSYLRTELAGAFQVLTATGARLVVANEPFNRRGEQPDGSLYPEDQPERVTRWNALLTAAVVASPGVRVLDLNHQLGPQGTFTWSVDGVQVRSDGVHLTPAGVSWLTPWLLSRLAAAAR